MLPKPKRTSPESGQAMNDEQLIDNALTFYLAGHETTAKALTWTLYLLARSPQWSAALKEEIARVTGGAAISGEHIDGLVRVRQVLQESMRLYPPAWSLARTTAKEMESRLLWHCQNISSALYYACPG